MEVKQVIDRLNELYHLQKNQGLTTEEAAERDSLRRVYLDAIKGQFKSTLERVRIVDEDGHQTELHCHDENCSCKH